MPLVICPVGDRLVLKSGNDSFLWYWDKVLYDWQRDR
jgi:hypothetical protein